MYLFITVAGVTKGGDHGCWVNVCFCFTEPSSGGRLQRNRKQHDKQASSALLKSLVSHLQRVPNTKCIFHGTECIMRTKCTPGGPSTTSLCRVMHSLQQNEGN